MIGKKIIVLCISIVFVSCLKAQPFVDVATFNTQHFFSNYTDSSKHKLFTQDNFLNLFLPKKFGKGHVFLLRVNAENLNINKGDVVKTSTSLYSLSMPVGVQLLSKNEKWKYTGIVIPKFNSDFKDDLGKDFQLGTIGLLSRVINPNLEIKAGLYYNREFFGDFFLPLVGVDWKINNRLRMYGTLPSNYRFEIKLSSKWNTGVGFRAFTRSFRLNNSLANDYVRINENQIKIYAEGFIYKKLALTLDVYQSIGYYLKQRSNSNIDQPSTIYAPFKDNIGFTVGFAYRIMK